MCVCQGRELEIKLNPLFKEKVLATTVHKRMGSREFSWLVLHAEDSYLDSSCLKVVFPMDFMQSNNF